MTPNNYPEGLDELAREVAKTFIINTQYIPFHHFRHYARALLDALAERGYVLVDAKKQEPACYLDLEKMTPSGMVYATGFRVNSKQSPLYTHHSTPGRVALPDGWKVIGEVIGCFDAAFAEGLQEALAETQDERLKDLVERRLMHALYAAQEAAPTPPTQPQGDGSLRRDAQWINPNDKTQARYLPYIGDRVLFCHGGLTYYGEHTGGSFRTGCGATARNFNTWECFWMYPPAAMEASNGNA